MARASHDLTSTLAGRTSAAESLARLANLARGLRAGAEALAAGADGDGTALRTFAAEIGAFAREASDLSRRHAVASSAIDGVQSIP